MRDGPILFMICIAVGALAGMVFFESVIIVPGHTFFIFKIEVAVGLSPSEASSTCEDDTCYDSMATPFSLEC